MDVFEYQVGDRVVAVAFITGMDLAEGDLGEIIGVDEDGKGVHVIWDRYIEAIGYNYTSRVWWIQIDAIRSATIFDEIAGWFKKLWSKIGG